MGEVELRRAARTGPHEGGLHDVGTARPACAPLLDEQLQGGREANTHARRQGGLRTARTHFPPASHGVWAHVKEGFMT